tara:strand:- start:571 stop:1761 length:1191 start_codon:yes stop_codon:yes gene_type:complete
MAKKAIEAVKEEGTFKIKKKPKKLIRKDKPIKIDLSKKEKEENAVPESITESVDARELPNDGPEVGETHIEEQTITQTSGKENKQQEKIEDVPVIQEIAKEKEEETKELVVDIQKEIEANPQLELPENIEKLVNFMKDTGGTVEDYVKLNADYSNINDNALLREYYKRTKPHLDSEEINFIMDDKFLIDEEYDEERAIRMKKLAKKEEIAKARTFLEESKSRYYDEIKLRPGATQEQQKATDFFNRYNENQEKAKQQHNVFKDTTNNLFNNDFKGFEFDLGEKKFRYSVNNPSDVANDQSNIADFVGMFLNEDGSVSDYKGYHKAIYAARNADTIASHFYEQGKADAIKNITAKSKNISNEPRAGAPGEVYLNGLKVKAISGVDSSKLKIKRKINN